MGLISKLISGLDQLSSPSTFDPSVGGVIELEISLFNTEDPVLSHEEFTGASLFFQSQLEPATNWMYARFIQYIAVSDISATIRVQVVSYSTLAAEADGWDVTIVDGPVEGFPFLGITGLLLTADGPLVTLAAGEIRDYSDTVNLILDNPITKDITSLWAVGDEAGGVQQSADLTGTITSVALAVTGTDTGFLGNFNRGAAIPDRAGGYLIDYTEQVAGARDWSSTAQGFIAPSIISSDGVTTTTPAVASDTALTTAAALGVAGATFKRGGICNAYYGVVLIRKDSDGTLDLCFSAFTGLGDPDIPTGYTFNRVVGMVEVVSGIVVAITQPLRDANDGVVSGTWTPAITFATLGNLNVVYSVQVGNYYRVGKLVFLTFQITTSTFTHTTAVGSLRITGLPFTSINTASQKAYGSLVYRGITDAVRTNMALIIAENTAYITLTQSGSGVAPNNISVTDMPTGGTVRLEGSIIYVAA